MRLTVRYAGDHAMVCKPSDLVKNLKARISDKMGYLLVTRDCSLLGKNSRMEGLCVTTIYKMVVVYSWSSDLWVVSEIFCSDFSWKINQHQKL